MLPKETIAAISKQLFESHYANFIENTFNQAWDVQMLTSTQSEYEESCAKFKEEIARLKADIDKLAIKKDKVSREQFKVLKNVVLPSRELNFNKFKIARSDLYKTVVERADKIDAARERLEFRKNWDGYVAKLPFLEIEGTRYECDTENNPKIDKDGNKVLFLGKNEPAIQDKKA